MVCCLPPRPPDGTVQVWDSNSGKRLAMTEGPKQHLSSIAFPSAGRVWALGIEGQALVLWDALTGVRLSAGEGHTSSVRLLAYVDGKTLCSPAARMALSAGGTSASARQLRRRLIRADDEVRSYGNVNAHVGNFALSSDGKFLATASDYGTNTIRLIDMESGKVVCDFDAPRANSAASGFAFSPDNTRLAVVGIDAVHIWDITTGQELSAFPFKTHSWNQRGAQRRQSRFRARRENACRRAFFLRTHDRQSGRRSLSLEPDNRR